MRFYNYLTEKTFRISKDVDYIYKRGFKEIINLINKDKLEEAKEYLENHKKRGVYTFLDIYTTELSSIQVQKANEIRKPANIICGVMGESIYKPSTNHIQISLNSQAIELILNKKTKEDINNMLPSGQLKRFWNEFDESNIKGSIYHELSHWLNNILHNKAVEKELTKFKQGKAKEIGDVNQTWLETDAQIHAIKQTKRSHKKDWDKISWFDIIQLKPSFYSVFTILTKQGEEEYKKHMKKLLKRMNRENLLGKRLEKIPSYREMQDFISHS